MECLKAVKTSQCMTSNQKFLPTLPEVQIPFIDTERKT